MQNLFDRMYIGFTNKVNRFVNSFKEDERGVSSFVATILLILIVVLLCAIFWEYISQWFETMWNKITGNANKIG